MQWLSDYAAMGVFVVDNDLNVRFWNRWMENHTGRIAGDVLGKSILKIYSEIEARGNAGYYAEALLGKSSILAHRFHQYLIPIPSTCGRDSYECMQ